MWDTNWDSSRGMTAANNNTKNLSYIYDLYSFLQIIEKLTRASLESKTLVDHIATNQDRNIIQSGVIDVSIRDHIWFTV